MNNKSQKLVQYSLDNKKAEIVKLNNLLEDDETCKVIVSCIYSGELGIVSITDKRLIIIRKKMFSSDIFKNFYDINEITKVVYDKGFLSTKLDLTISDELVKITDVSSIYLDEVLNAFSGDNIVKLTKKENDKILKDVNEEVKRKEFERIMASNPTISKKPKSVQLVKEPKELSKRQQKKQYEKERLEQLKRDKIPYCPKCHSTSLTYQNKKLSVGRAITGKILFGEEGAILGGLSSKKGYVKCLKCGHHWKL
ncbi:TPA: hypothetical protein I9064_000834 [Clostridium perfringens]|nr:hypothetical protein [Clostridium perfringens]